MPTSVRTPRRLRAIAALAGVGALATVVAVAPADPAPEPWAADGRARVPAETGTSGLTPQTTTGSHPPATIASAPLSEQVLVAASTDAIETAPAPVETADADAEAAEPDPAPPSAASVWDRVADCESGEWTGSGGVVAGSANWSATAGQFEGGLQFHPDTWDGYRDPTMPAAAYEASRPQQIAVAERVLAEQGWPAWPTCSRKLGLR